MNTASLITRNRATLKLMFVAALSLSMLIPLFMVRSIILERQGLQMAASPCNFCRLRTPRGCILNPIGLIPNLSDSFYRLSAVLKLMVCRRRRGYLAGAMMSITYVLLYVLVSSRHLSLLLGSLALLAAIASLMYLARNVDWYNYGGSE